MDGLTCSHNYDGVLRIYFDKPQDGQQAHNTPDMILRQTDRGWQDARLADDGLGVISSERLARLCVSRLGELAFDLICKGKLSDTTFGIRYAD